MVLVKCQNNKHIVVFQIKNFYFINKMKILTQTFNLAKQLTIVWRYSQSSLEHKLFQRLPAVLLPSGQKYFHTTNIRNELMEFFDDKKNWGENEVKVGRSWAKDELRIKSNGDLHKLWFVLLKERNMLMTMEHECDAQMELFPSPERIDKVKLSMENLEEVVRERNRAYNLLETGETGERQGKLKTNQLGVNYYYKETEHLIPAQYNQAWKLKQVAPRGSAVSKFLLKYREKLWNEKRKKRNRDRNEVVHLLKRNPNLDRNVLNEKFPTVDIDKLIKSNKIRGHYVPSAPHTA